MLDIQIKGIESLQRKLKEMPDLLAKSQVDAARRTTRKARNEARCSASTILSGLASFTMAG